MSSSPLTFAKSSPPRQKIHIRPKRIVAQQAFVASPVRQVQRPTRRQLIAQFMGTGVNSVHKAVKNRSQNIRGAAFTELVRRVAECKIRKLGRRLTKDEVEGIMSAVTAIFIATKQTPRSENINKITSRWVGAICKTDK